MLRRLPLLFPWAMAIAAGMHLLSAADPADTVVSGDLNTTVTSTPSDASTGGITSSAITTVQANAQVKLIATDPGKVTLLPGFSTANATGLMRFEAFALNAPVVVGLLGEPTMTVSEGNAAWTLNINVGIIGPYTANYPITIGWSVSGITGYAPRFSAATGSVVLPAGQRSIAIARTVNGNTSNETGGNDITTATLTLTSTDLGTLMSGRTGLVLTIIDDEVPGIGFSTASSTVTEGTATAAAMAFLPFTNAIAAATTAVLEFGGNAVYGVDYQSTSFQPINPATGRITLAASATGAYIALPNASPFWESTDVTTLTVKLVAADGLTIDPAKTTHTLTIKDRELPGITFPLGGSSTTSVVAENAGTIAVPVEITQKLPTLLAITVPWTWTLSGGSSTRMTTTSGSVTIPVSATSANIVLSLNDNNLYEPADQDTVGTLTLGSATNAIVDTTNNAHKWTVKITDDDSVPSVITPPTISPVSGMVIAPLSVTMSPPAIAGASQIKTYYTISQGTSGVTPPVDPNPSSNEYTMALPFPTANEIIIKAVTQATIKGQIRTSAVSVARYVVAASGDANYPGSSSSTVVGTTTSPACIEFNGVLPDKAEDTRVVYAWGAVQQSGVLTVRRKGQSQSGWFDIPLDPGGADTTATLQIKLGTNDWITMATWKRKWTTTAINSMPISPPPSIRLGDGWRLVTSAGATGALTYRLVQGATIITANAATPTTPVSLSPSKDGVWTLEVREGSTTGPVRHSRTIGVVGSPFYVRADPAVLSGTGSCTLGQLANLKMRVGTALTITDLPQNASINPDADGNIGNFYTTQAGGITYTKSGVFRLVVKNEEGTTVADALVAVLPAVVPGQKKKIPLIAGFQRTVKLAVTRLDSSQGFNPPEFSVEGHGGSTAGTLQLEAGNDVASMALSSSVLGKSALLARLSSGAIIDAVDVNTFTFEKRVETDGCIPLSDNYTSEGTSVPLNNGIGHPSIPFWFYGKSLGWIVQNPAVHGVRTRMRDVAVLFDDHWVDSWPGAYDVVVPSAVPTSPEVRLRKYGFRLPVPDGNDHTSWVAPATGGVQHLECMADPDDQDGTNVRLNGSNGEDVSPKVKKFTVTIAMQHFTNDEGLLAWPAGQRSYNLTYPMPGGPPLFGNSNIANTPGGAPLTSYFCYGYDGTDVSVFDTSFQQLFGRHYGGFGIENNPNQNRNKEEFMNCGISFQVNLRFDNPEEKLENNELFYLRVNSGVNPGVSPDGLYWQTGQIEMTFDSPNSLNRIQLFNHPAFGSVFPCKGKDPDPFQVLTEDRYTIDGTNKNWHTFGIAMDAKYDIGCKIGQVVHNMPYGNNGGSWPGIEANVANLGYGKRWNPKKYILPNVRIKTIEIDNSQQGVEQFLEFDAPPPNPDGNFIGGAELFEENVLKDSEFIDNTGVPISCATSVFKRRYVRALQIPGKYLVELKRDGTTRSGGLAFKGFQCDIGLSFLGTKPWESLGPHINSVDAWCLVGSSTRQYVSSSSSPAFTYFADAKGHGILEDEEIQPSNPNRDVTWTPAYVHWKWDGTDLSGGSASGTFGDGCPPNQDSPVPDRSIG